MATLRLFVSDVERASSFYQFALGFVETERWGPAMAILARGDLEIWLAGPPASASQPWSDGTQPVPGGFGRMVLPLEAFDKVAIELAGGAVKNGPLKGPGGTQLVVADPDGNSIEFFG